MFLVEFSNLTFENGASGKRNSNVKFIPLGSGHREQDRKNTCPRPIVSRLVFLRSASDVDAGASWAPVEAGPAGSETGTHQLDRAWRTGRLICRGCSELGGAESAPAQPEPRWVGGNAGIECNGGVVARPHVSATTWLGGGDLL